MLAVFGRYILLAGALSFLWATVFWVSDEIQLKDSLGELVKIEGLNAFETDEDVFHCCYRG